MLGHRLDNAVLIAGRYVVHPADIPTINLVTDPVLGLVLVGFLRRHSTIIVNILESLRGQSTAASMVVEVAGTIDELLLGQALPVSTVLGMGDAIVSLEGVEIVENNEKPLRLVFYDFGQACALSDDQAGGILDVIEGIADMNAEV